MFSNIDIFLKNLNLDLPEDPQIAALLAEKEYIESEIDLPIFQSAIRLERIGSEDVIWNATMTDLKSAQSKRITEAVLPTVNSVYS